MGHMKWIHCMVADNSYELFKTCYETAKKSKSKSFMFNHSKIDTNYAKYVCEFVDKHCMPEYEEHLVNSVNK